MLAKYAQPKKNQWSSFLDTCVFSYITSKHDSSRFTPFQLLFGQCATLPIDLDVRAALPEEEASRFLGMQEPDQVKLAEEKEQLLEEAKTNIIVAQARQKAVYDKKHAQPDRFQNGQLVLKKDFTRKKKKNEKEVYLYKVSWSIHHSKRAAKRHV